MADDDRRSWPLGDDYGAVRRPRWLRGVGQLLPLVLLVVATWAIHLELRRLRWSEIEGALSALPGVRLAGALILTAVSFVVLTGYDVLGLRFARHRLPYRQTAFASFLAFSVSQALGFPLMTGVPIRYRLYCAWGLSVDEVADLLTSYVSTFWIGCLVAGGVALLVEPSRLLPLLHATATSARPLGAVLLIIAAVYLSWAARARRGLRLGRWQVRPPGPRLAAAQLVLGSVDWCVSAAVLYVLLPVGGSVLPYPTFVGLFLLAQLAGLVSQVPGGLGVFEALILALMPDEAGSGSVLASLVAYRALYYLLPLMLALASLGAYELRSRRERLQQAGSVVARGISTVVPPAVATALFVAGLVLIFSGALPAASGRLDTLARLMPLAVVEFSHLAASLVGAFLLILAWAAQRRLEVAYHLALALLLAGAVLSLTKGLDYEEAAILTAMAIALLATGREFYRRSSLLAEAWTPGWGVAIGGVFIAAAGLWVVAHRQPLLLSEVWRFAWDQEAPRSMRATAGALAFIGAFAVAKLLSPAAPRLGTPTESDRRDARAIATACPRTYAQLVLLEDKQLLFDEARTSFIMYAVGGRCWVAMGDPVGDEQAGGELAWRFRALAHRHADWSVFYEVTPEYLPLYLDLGLTMTKLGEEARVRLRDFSLEGGARKSLRRSVRTVEKTGATFRMLAPEAVRPILPDLRRVSDEWLSKKTGREKGFSLGFFQEAYLTQTRVALLELDGAPVAFANVIEGAGHHEATVDLMRYGHAAPRNAMEYLLTQAMLWSRSRGFEWFSLGMAPLSGLEARPLAPLWTRLGAAIFRYGEHFYRFEGLREYKEGFGPVWEPRYLASTRGAALPRVLADVAILISGGLAGVVHRR